MKKAEEKEMSGRQAAKGSEVLGERANAGGVLGLAATAWAGGLLLLRKERASGKLNVELVLRQLELGERTGRFRNRKEKDSMADWGGKESSSRDAGKRG